MTEKEEIDEMQKITLHNKIIEERKARKKNNLILFLLMILSCLIFVYFSMNADQDYYKLKKSEWEKISNECNVPGVAQGDFIYVKKVDNSR